jgi:hypothetical protein
MKTSKFGFVRVYGWFKKKDNLNDSLLIYDAITCLLCKLKEF